MRNKFYLLLFVIFICNENKIFSQALCNTWLNNPTVGSAINIGDLDISGNQITVEAIFNRTTPFVGGNLYAGDLVSKHITPANTNYLLRPNNAEITTSDGYFITPGICNIELNKTYHVAMVYDGSQLKFYRNGYLMSQVAATGNLFQNDFDTRIGYYAAEFVNTQFVGYINEVRIWDVAKSQNDLITNMNTSLSSPQTQAGLKGYYIFNDLLNKQGNSVYNGTINGNATINNLNPNCSLVIDSCPVPIMGPNISNIINQYTPVISFGSCKNEILVEDAANYKVGDTVLIIQMKGAAIDSSNTANFGTITNYNNAGNYEFNYIKKISGNSISLKNIVTRLYDLPNGKVQLIRVPYYDSAKVIATLTCLPWDGKKGGVLAFNVNNKLTLNANIDVSNKGFRGGRSLNQFNTSLTCFFNDFTYPSGTIQAAEKGESIYNIGLQNGSAKGSNANGGGGGNGHNSGGGGGGNGGKGGLGGYQLEICGNAPYDNRGFGGKELIYTNASNKIFMGGGGGSGQTDNAGGIDMNGGDGGGIILISANILEPNNFQIVSSGQAAQICNNATNNCHDGSGGGGSGGSILLSVNNYTSNVNVKVSGGKGGDLVIYNNLGAGRIGTGGGGGGGTIWVKQVSLPTPVIANVSAGSNGTILQDNSNPWGATSGLNGQILNSLSLPIDNIPFQPKIDSIRFLNQNTSCSNFTFSGLNYPNTSSINNWQWTFGDGALSNSQNPQHTYTTSGTFQVTLVTTEPTGCKDSTTQTITTTALQVDAGNDSTFCADTKQVNLNVTTNQTGVAYNWNSTATLNNNTIANPTATIDTTTTFYVTVSLPNGCSSKDSVKFTLNKIPIVKTLKDTTICKGNALILTSTTGLDSYNWSNGIYVSDSTISNPNFIDTSSQTLFLSGTKNGCTARDTINIRVNPLPTIKTIKDTITCSTNSIILNTTGGNTYAWFPTNNLSNPNSSAPVFMGNANITYFVTGTITNTGCKNIDTINITVNIPNSFVQPPSKSVCIKDSVMLDGNNGLNAQYNWTGPNLSNSTIINPIANPLTTTNYQVSIFDKYCNTTQVFPVPVSVLALPIINAEKSNDVNCIVPSAELLASGANNYLWSPAQTLNDSTIKNPLATPDITTTYTVTGTDNNKCVGKSSITVNKDNSFGIINLPNIFTPNKDNKNDCFKVLVKGQIKNYTMMIFNRWGEKVFETHNSNDCWNGKYKGRDVEIGNYVYYLSAKTLCGEFSKKGNLLLIR
jgi:gliding motility-associated-like protein